MPAMDTLILKQQLLDDTRTPVWHNFMKHYADSLTGRAKDGTAPTALQGRDDVTGETMTSQIVRDLQMSHAYYVTSDMQALVTAAAEKMPSDTVVRAQDFPTPQGWLVIPGGITHLDVRGLPVSTSAILWSVWGGSVHLTLFADKNHPTDRARFATAFVNDDADPEMREVARQTLASHRVLPRLTPWADAGQPLEQPITQVMLSGTVIPPEDARQMTFHRHNGNMTIHFPTGFSPESMNPHLEPAPVTRWLVACLRIMAQPLASIETIGVPANLRKQFRKSPVKMKHTLVTVITFRRREGRGLTGSGREYSHRFLRRGFWRKQWYKPVAHGEWDYYEVYIHPVIVGDPSKPLILREHVNVLSR